MKNEPKLASRDDVREQLFKSMGPKEVARYQLYKYVIDDILVGVKVSKEEGNEQSAQHLQRLAGDLRMVSSTHAAVALADNPNSEQELQEVDPLTGLLMGNIKDMINDATDDK